MHTSTPAAFGNVSSHSCEFFTANSQFKHAPPAPSTPARTAQFRWRRYSSRLIERAGSNFSALRTAAPERMQALGLSVGVVGTPTLRRFVGVEFEKAGQPLLLC